MHSHRPRDSSTPGRGRSVGSRADREDPPEPPSNTRAGARSALSRSSSRPRARAATACSRHIAPAAGQLGRLPRQRPHRPPPDRAPAAPATSHPRQCGAAAAAGRARSRPGANSMRPERQLAPEVKPLLRRRRQRRRQPRLLTVSPSAGPRAHQAPGSPGAAPCVSGKTCAGSHGAPAGRRAPPPAPPPRAPLKPQRQGNVVGRARPFQAMKEPQPPLGKGQRDLGRARAPHQRRTLIPARLRPPRQSLHPR